jgi:hypothetical protein
VPIPDLDSVIEEAVLAYVTAKKRTDLQRYSESGYSPEDLVSDHSDYYSLSGTDKKVKFTGRSAGNVIEDYLQLLGYPRCSDQWFTLAHIVIERGEFESCMGPRFQEDL